MDLSHKKVTRVLQCAYEINNVANINRLVNNKYHSYNTKRHKAGNISLFIPIYCQRPNHTL